MTSKEKRMANIGIIAKASFHRQASAGSGRGYLNWRRGIGHRRIVHPSVAKLLRTADCRRSATKVWSSEARRRSATC